MSLQTQRLTRTLSVLTLIIGVLMFGVPSASAVGTATANFSLPITVGQSLVYTQGPHGGIGQPIPSALDLVPRDGLVRAAADGVVEYSTSCANNVMVRHANGWKTGYAHLTSVRVYNGQVIHRGDILGNISAQSCDGGSATGAHVHMWVTRNGVNVDLHGLIIGGWYVQPNNCLQRLRDALVVCTWGSVYNNGMAGFGGPTTYPTVRPGVCSGTGCNNQPPGPSGCASSGVQTPKQAAIRNRYGTQIGTVQLKWSTKCQTNWGAIFSSVGTRTIYEMVVSRGAGPFVDLDDYTYGFSPMVYAPNIQARACGGLISGDFVQGYSCTDWY
jgi:murein DD-endopeptidase MepM/ murein hydrolase activator NlpD